MSDRQVKEALLQGYGPPVFPATLPLLREAQDTAGIRNGHKLEIVGNRIKGFLYLSQPTTSDGYGWFWALHFRRGKTKIAILFPWAQDFKSQDGDQSDRSIAVYIQGETNTEVGSLIMELISEMQKLGAEITAKEFAQSDADNFKSLRQFRVTMLAILAIATIVGVIAAYIFTFAIHPVITFFIVFAAVSLLLAHNQQRREKKRRSLY